MQPKRVEQSDGQWLSYTTYGEGPAVLLIHGITMWSKMWLENGVVDAICAKSKVIVPDLRGHGKSAKPHDPALYGEALVRDLVSVLENEEEKEAHVIGFSLGAELALKLATSQPEKVLSLLLIGSGWSGKDVMPIYQEFANWARETGDLMTPEPDYDALDALVAAMPDIIDIPREEIERLRLRSAGIAGSEDPELPNLKRLVGVLKGFELAVLSGVPHETSWRDPSLPSRVENFLKLSFKDDAF
ncbi:MAG: alpha/beta hydrolase [Rhodobacteraceae bacterium]|nr:alpha/beta hydrolase [Paracoccaceae bacterium]